MTISEKSPSKILIVDDIPMNIELLEGILSPGGYVLDSALSGEEALEKIKKRAPDLILLDVMMPGMDGYEVSRRIRKDSSLPYIPIIFVTASERQMKDILVGFDAGADDYIRKPVNPAELLARIMSCLRIKKLYEELAKMKTELSRYVSLPTLKMVEGKINGRQGDESRNTYGTVLFSDIRGFTQSSEGMDPQSIFSQLNANIEKQLGIIQRHQGMVDKLSGDEVMAIFEGPEMVEQALGSALAIVRSLSESLGDEKTGLPYVGIGIDTGLIHLGSLGNESFLDYTAIGNTVNIAARLCGLAGKCQVLLTRRAVESVAPGRFRFKSIGEKRLKGLSRPVEVFQAALWALD